MYSMEERYQRDLKNNCLVISQNNSKDPEHYRIQMITKNEIPHFLKCNIQMIDNKIQFYYDITGCKNLSSLYQESQMTGEHIKKLVLGLQKALREVEEFLLDVKELFIDPDYIYVNLHTNDPYFCYLPLGAGENHKSFHQLAQFILNHLNHKEDMAVQIGYALYKLSMEENYNIHEIVKTVFCEYLDVSREDETKQKDETKRGYIEKEEEDSFKGPYLKEEKGEKNGIIKKMESIKVYLILAIMILIGSVTLLFFKRSSTTLKFILDILKKGIGYFVVLMFLMFYLFGPSVRDKVTEFLKYHGKDRSKRKTKTVYIPDIKNKRKIEKKEKLGNWNLFQERKKNKNKENPKGSYAYYHNEGDNLGKDNTNYRNYAYNNYENYKNPREAGSYEESQDQKDSRNRLQKKDTPYYREGEMYEKQMRQVENEMIWEEQNNNYHQKHIDEKDHRNTQDYEFNKHYKDNESKKRVKSHEPYVEDLEDFVSLEEKEKVEYSSKNSSKNIREAISMQRKERKLISVQSHQYPHITLTPKSIKIGKLSRICDVIISNPMVSRVHAEVNRVEENYYLVDLGSTNGTFVNGVKIEKNESYLLQVGDEILFANIKYYFC